MEVRFWVQVMHDVPGDFGATSKLGFVELPLLKEWGQGTDLTGKEISWPLNIKITPNRTYINIAPGAKKVSVAKAA